MSQSMSPIITEETGPSYKNGMKEHNKVHDRIRRGLDYALFPERSRKGKSRPIFDQSMFLEWIKASKYRYFFEVVDIKGINVVWKRLLSYFARLKPVELEAWSKTFQDGERLKPGFFLHPMECPDLPDMSHGIEKVCHELDPFVKYGLIHHPRSLPLQKTKYHEPRPELLQTYYPNPHNKLPKHVIESRPELEGKTREEAWLQDVEQRDRLMVLNQRCKAIVAHVVTALQGLDSETANEVRAVLEESLLDLEKESAGSPQYSEYNAARACIEWDAGAEARKREAEEVRAKLRGVPVAFPPERQRDLVKEKTLHEGATAYHDRASASGRPVPDIPSPRSRTLNYSDRSDTFHDDSSNPPTPSSRRSSPERLSREVRESLVRPRDRHEKRPYVDMAGDDDSIDVRSSYPVGKGPEEHRSQGPEEAQLSHPKRVMFKKPFDWETSHWQ
ncbi:hypothetical protein V8F20_012210 [Naviculisporaceae sp. PSN 640]